MRRERMAHLFASSGFNSLVGSYHFGSSFGLNESSNDLGSCLALNGSSKLALSAGNDGRESPAVASSSSVESAATACTAKRSAE